MVDLDDSAPWKALYQYWVDRHVDGRPPGRRNIDPPIEIPRLIQDLMLVSVGPDGFRYRLVGTAIASYMKVDVTGRQVAATAWAADEVRSDWLNLLTAVSESQKPQLVITKFPTSVQAYNHCLVLPLVGSDGRTEQLLIGVFYGGHIDPDMPIEGLTTREVAPPSRAK